MERSSGTKVHGFFNGVSNVMAFFVSLRDSVPRWLAHLGGLLFASGARAMSQFAAGIGSLVGGIVTQIQSLAGGVAGYLAHHSPAKMGPLADDDKWMGTMLHTTTTTLPLDTPSPTPFVGGMSGSMFVDVQVDNTHMATVVLDRNTWAARVLH